MDIPAISGPSRFPFCQQRGRAAFSLVEVTLAIGIVAFAFVTLLGLIPVGLTTFRRAIDASVGSQISQHVINDAQQTDFNTLAKGAKLTVGSIPFSTRYFDDQGNEVTTPAQALYVAKTYVALAQVPGDTALTIPSDTTDPLDYLANLAVVNVQLANYPVATVQMSANGLVSRNQPAPTSNP